MTLRLNSTQMMTSRNERNIIFLFFLFFLFLLCFVLVCFPFSFSIITRKMSFFWLFHLWIASRNQSVPLEILDAFRFVNYYFVQYFWQAYTYLLPQQFGCVYSAMLLAKFFFFVFFLFCFLFCFVLFFFSTNYPRTRVCEFDWKSRLLDLTKFTWL